MALEGAYAFDDVASLTVQDLSGNGRHIDLTGTNGAQVDSAGALDGGALGKTGADTIVLPAGLLAACESDDRGLMFDALGQRSVWWVRIQSGGSGVWGLLSLDATTMITRARDQSSGNPTPVGPTVGALSNAARHNFGMTYVRATGVLTYYFDGAPVGTQSFAPGTAVFVGGDDLSIAEWTSAGPALDNLRFFSHAPSDAEMLALASTPVTAAEEETGDLAATLDGVTMAALAEVTADVDLVATLATPTMAATAEVTADATLTASLASITLQADADAEVLATLAGTLAKATADFQAETEQDMAPSATSPVLCSSWATTDDLTESQLERLTALGATTDDINAALMRASELLWAFSGRQWLGGGCEEDAVLRSIEPVSGTGAWPYSSTWGHCQCWSYADWSGNIPSPALGISLSHIGQPIAVQLPRRPVTAITSVTVGGDPFIAWTLRPSGWLQRTDGRGWNVCDGDTEVTYTFGDPPPAGGRDAAIDLGIELMLDKLGSDECRLPPQTVSVTRQGITMELLSTDRPGQRTNLPLVDMWLDAVNPYRAPQSAQVWSPDVPRLARFGATREV